MIDLSKNRGDSLDSSGPPEMAKQRNCLVENKFYAASHLGAFTAIDKSKSICETILWYIIMAFFAFLTVRGCLDLVTHFEARSRLTSASSSRENGIEVPPNVTFCFDTPWPKIDPLLANRDKTTLVTSGGKTRKTSPLRELLKTYRSRNFLLDQQWADDFLEVCHNYLAFLTLADTKSKFLDESWTSTFGQFLELANVSLVDLGEKYSSEMLQWTGFEFESTNVKFLDVLPNQDARSANVCYQATNSSQTFYIKLAADSKLNPNPNMYLTLQYFDNQKEILLTNLMDITVTPTAYFASARNCSTFHSKYKCLATCLADYVTVTCGCTPLSYRSLCSKAVKDVCTMDRYLYCSKKPKTFDSSKCACPEHCSQMLYRLDTEHSLKNDKNGWKVAFTVKDAEFPVFEELQTRSFTLLLAHLGGLLNVWLGASAIGLLHLLWHLLKQLSYLCDRGTRNYKRLRKLFGKKLEPVKSTRTVLGIAAYAPAVEKAVERINREVGEMRKEQRQLERTLRGQIAVLDDAVEQLMNERESIRQRKLSHRNTID